MLLEEFSAVTFFEFMSNYTPLTQAPAPMRLQYLLISRLLI